MYIIYITGFPYFFHSFQTKLDHFPTELDPLVSRDAKGWQSKVELHYDRFYR